MVFLQTRIPRAVPHPTDIAQEHGPPTIRACPGKNNMAIGWQLAASSEILLLVPLVSEAHIAQ